MRVIYKYPVTVTRTQEVVMPLGAKILSAQEQDGAIQLWVYFVPGVQEKKRIINIFGTGDKIEGNPGEFIATVQTGPYAWHIFDGGEVS